MSPERAKVFVVEDSRQWRNLIIPELEFAGHEVVVTSTTLQEALEAVGTLTQLGIQVAIIDGNLSKEDTSGSDGRKILESITEKAPEVKTIGLSMDKVVGVDVDLGKKNLNSLGQAVTEI